MLTHAKGSFLYHFIQAFVAGHAFGHETRVVILAVGGATPRPRSLTVTGIARPLSQGFLPEIRYRWSASEFWKFGPFWMRARVGFPAPHILWIISSVGFLNAGMAFSDLHHTSFSSVFAFRHLSRFDPCWLLVQQNRKVVQKQCDFLSRNFPIIFEANENTSLLNLF